MQRTAPPPVLDLFGPVPVGSAPAGRTIVKGAPNGSGTGPMSGSGTGFAVGSGTAYAAGSGTAAVGSGTTAAAGFGTAYGAGAGPGYGTGSGPGSGAGWGTAFGVGLSAGPGSAPGAARSAGSAGPGIAGRLAAGLAAGSVPGRGVRTGRGTGLGTELRMGGRRHRSQGRHIRQAGYSRPLSTPALPETAGPDVVNAEERLVLQVLRRRPVDLDAVQVAVLSGVPPSLATAALQRLVRVELVSDVLVSGRLRYGLP